MNVNTIPVSIKASSMESLSLAMFENNLKYSKHYHYFDIQKIGKEWIAWYFRDIILDKVVQ